MSQLRMRVLVAVLLSCAWACGDDDSSKNGKDAALPVRDGGSAGKNGNAGNGNLGGDSGIGPSSPGDEGWPCQAVSDCNKGFACVENIFADQSGQPIGVCARGCKTDPDCETDEVCFGYTGRDQDKHCVNQVTKEYGICGVGDTSVCKDRSCLYFPNSPFGVCIDTCAVAGGGDNDGGTDDAGAPSGTVTCSKGETCVDGVLSDPMSNEGVCGTVVARGDACGIDVGKYCKTGDICAPEDPADLMNSTPRCFENCGDTGMCKQGKCMVVQMSFAYCM